MTRFAACCTAILLLVWGGRLAHAVTVELWPESYFQLQQYRDVDRLRIDKTRFTQYLTLNLYEEADNPHHLFFASFRIDSDLGRDNSPDANPDPLAYHSLALMYAYYEWRRIADAVDITLGRQILSDGFGFAAMDGLKVRVEQNWFVGVELYAGAEVKGGLNETSDGFMLPNSDTFEPDGVYLDDRQTGIFGATLFLDDIEGTDLQLAYRHRYSGETDGQQLGLVFHQELFDVWRFYTTDNFNLYTEQFDLLEFGTEVDFGWITARLEHAATNPTFDADSIFNFFRHNAHKEISARVYFAPDERTHIGLGYSRLLQGTELPIFDSWGHEGNASHEGDLYATRRFGDYTDARFRYAFSRGWGGQSHRFALGAGTYVWQRRIRLDLSWMGTQFSELTYIDMLGNNHNSGFSWGLSGISEFLIHPSVSISLQGEVNSNRYIERQFALFSLLDVHFWR